MHYISQASVVCHFNFREDSDEYRLKLSDVYFTLGEVALESGLLHIMSIFSATCTTCLKCIIYRPGRPGCGRYEHRTAVEGAVA